MITHTQLCELLDYDPQTGKFIWKVNLRGHVKVGRIAGTPDKDGYIIITINQVRFRAHTLAWFYVHAVWPKLLDHINQIKNDNRVENLRECTLSQNQINSGLPKNNTSGYRGVFWYKPYKKWKACIGIRGKSLHLGYFKCIEQAVAAYDWYVTKVYGEFAQTNSTVYILE